MHMSPLYQNTVCSTMCVLKNYSRTNDVGFQKYVSTYRLQNSVNGTLCLFVANYCTLLLVRVFCNMTPSCGSAS